MVDRKSGSSPSDDPESLAARGRIVEKLGGILSSVSGKGLPSPPSRKAVRSCLRFLSIGDYRKAMSRLAARPHARGTAAEMQAKV